MSNFNFCKTLFLTLFCIIISKNCYSQNRWTRITSYYKSCVYLNEDIVISVGESGVIIRSLDSGETWDFVSSNTSYRLNSVAKISNSTLIAVGDNGTIVYSDNSGENWKKITTNTTNSLLSVCAFDSNNLTIVGESGLILKSDNGGITFTKISSPTNNRIFKIINNTNHSATAICDSAGVIYTNDKGNTWRLTVINGIDNINPEYLYYIDFFNDKIGTIGAAYHILRTEDGGETWRELFLNGKKPTSVPNLKHISSDTLIAVSNLILISVDSGKTWSQTKDEALNLELNNFGSSIIKNGTQGIIVGNLILRSTDNFNSLKTISKSTGGGGIYDLLTFDDTSLFVGRELSRNGSRSCDKGVTWKTPREGFRFCNKFYQISADSGFAFWLGNNYSNGFSSWVTSNRGNSWRSAEINFNLSDYDFKTKLYLAGVSFYGRYNAVVSLNEYYSRTANNKILYSKDGFVNWDTAFVDNIPNSEYGGLFLINEKLGFATSRSIVKNKDSSFTTIHRIYKTTNGGENWVTNNQIVIAFKDSILLKNIFFKDSLEGFIVGGNLRTGGVLYHTTSGGVTWDTIKFNGLKSINNIKFFNKNIGYLLGSQGALFSSSDGGKSWNKENLWYEELNDSTFELKDIYLMKDRKTLFLTLSAGGDMILRRILETPISDVEEKRVAGNNITTISPNPARGRALLGIEQNSGGGVVLLYNTLGQEVQHIEFGNVTNVSLDLSGLVAGCYNAVIKTKRGVAVKKIIVN